MGNAYLFRVYAENQVGVGPAEETKESIVAKLPYGNSFINVDYQLQIQSFWALNAVKPLEK